jgi:hypothetical protein
VLALNVAQRSTEFSQENMTDMENTVLGEWVRCFLGVVVVATLGVEVRLGRGRSV